jgi:phage tail sheath protein FI
MILRTILHSDEQSYPWIAPAGTRRGGVDNADAIGYINAATGEFVQIATRQGVRDVLYSNSVNPIAVMPGAGIVNFGNLTTAPGTAMDRVNVSRLVSYIRIQLDQIGKQFVFEPNDKITRDEIKGRVERMLNDIVAKRGVYAYVVICDESNNTASRIDRNELILDVGIEPVKSAEFILIPVRIRSTGTL